MPMQLTRLSDEIVYEALIENFEPIQESLKRIMKVHPLTKDQDLTGTIDFKLKRSLLGDRVFVEFEMLKFEA